MDGMPITREEIVAAVARGRLDFARDFEAAAMAEIRATAEEQLASLPEQHRCAAVEFELQTAVLVGMACGYRVSLARVQEALMLSQAAVRDARAEVARVESGVRVAGWEGSD